ncbi:uncharacterized protein P174DRAFT_94024 [Aspergillus novofumigatus IBT 16806]|uniref:Secreted protein n=1 Tax=Aspergillus novofumigatus (strain IBT 16806) TaxID=1392255 RepID=A0A2I1CH12_ASPN1|nr:uncharacterized protein P174DRAFT_94024 [Aspergillus novofumigatus IBT 16806]PKX96880.1 hypothetical protein P174DRAFT_94024 [Aspergillus novofumigatus IBT 16806]
MLFLLLITMLLNPFRPCEGSPIFQEEYRASYVPNVIKQDMATRLWRRILHTWQRPAQTSYTSSTPDSTLRLQST